MALIIKADMPTCCYDCDMSRVDYDYDLYVCHITHNEFDYREHKRNPNCPILGVIPDNHGRIVDLDMVLDWLANDKRCFSMAMTSKIKKALSDAPTVLEASDNICPADDDDHSYEMQSDMRDYYERYEQTYNPEDGSV